jgi:hypothetical protein
LRGQLYPSLKFAYEDYVFGYEADEPMPLTQSYDQFDESELVNSRTSRFTVSSWMWINSEWKAILNVNSNHMCAFPY